MCLLQATIIDRNQKKKIVLDYDTRLVDKISLEFRLITCQRFLKVYAHRGQPLTAGMGSRVIRWEGWPFEGYQSPIVRATIDKYTKDIAVSSQWQIGGGVI